MRILITGANGFVGKHLVRHLLQSSAQHEIVGLERHAPATPSTLGSRYRDVAIDLANPDTTALADFAASFRPEAVYHLAGIASGAAADREKVFDVNVEGTRRVLDAASTLPTPCRCLVMSTGYIYGTCTPDRPAREEDPPAAEHVIGIYGESKKATEKVAREYGALIIRSFNMTGPEQTQHFVVPSFARQIALIEAGIMQPEISVGNLDAWRDFFDIRDAVRGISGVMDAGVPGTAYNVCSGKAHLVGDVLQQFLHMAKVTVSVTNDPARMRASDIPYNVGDPSRLHELTGWRTEYELRQTLTDTLEWWRQRVQQEPQVA